MPDQEHKPVYEVDGKMVDANGNEVSAKEVREAKADAEAAHAAAEAEAEHAAPPVVPVVAAVPAKKKAAKRK